jgi:hypothetical protein
MDGVIAKEQSLPDNPLRLENIPHLKIQDFVSTKKNSL